MPRNIEIKAHIAEDAFASLRNRIVRLAGEPVETLQQRDTFFHVNSGRLKLREHAGGRAELIFYRRDDRAGPKTSTYQRLPCDEPEKLASVLGQALGVRGAVEKTRELFLIGQTRIHFDEVRHLGRFLELEVVLQENQSESDGQFIAEALLEKLGIASGNLEPQAYIDLLEKNNASR